MTAKESFVENAIKSFSKIMKEAKKDSPEHDLRYKFVEYFIKETLGYETKYINWEVKRADLTIVDENGFAIIKIETKKPQEDIDKAEHEEQAFKYEEGETKFIGLTNFKRLKIWEITKAERKLIMDMDFSKIEGKKEISQEEKAQILTLSLLSKESIFSPSVYQKFDETYARIDITKEDGFKKLLDRLSYIANNLLLEYTLKSFGEYKEGYGKYRAEAEKADAALKSKISGEIKQRLAKYRMKLETDYGKYLSFSGFELWKCHSGKENLPDDEVIEVFCKETIYVLLNKLLFIRICEDSGLLPKNISNGGIEKLRELMFEKEAPYKEIIETSFRFAAGLYAHFYETGVLDWFRTGDGGLNRLLNRVLWTLNQFNFAHVDRDILGNLYEKYLPSVERKKLGEFYTPTEVIDYILDSVGYTYNDDIKTKDLLDPACGSGGFLVRATRTLISKYLITFGKADKKELKDPKKWKEIVSRLSPDEAKNIIESVKAHIFGLDINPFAVHIAEMNMLFQIIDLYQKVREKYKDYKIGRFNIHRTDSLEFPKQKQISDYGSHLAVFEEQEEINDIKSRKFDFVVGNPPYVRVQMLDEWTKEYLREKYKTAYSNFDLYVIFIERGLNWLKENGKFGYIVSSKFTKTEYGKYIRSFIVKNSHIHKFIDLRGSKIFASVAVDPCILILDKNKPAQIACVSVKKDFEAENQKESLSKLMQHIISNEGKEYRDSYMESFFINQEKLRNDIKRGNGKEYMEEWKIANEKQSKIVRKIEQTAKHRLNDISVDIQTGIQTGFDEIFVMKKDAVDREKIERGILKKFIFGKNVRRWKIEYDDYFVIYPYELIDGKTTLISEKKFMSNYSNAYSYLKKHIEELKKRWGVVIWYELPTKREIDWFSKPKILTPDISTENNFALDNGEFYFPKKPVYGILLKDEFNKYLLYVLGLLNSKILYFYFRQIATFLGKEGYRYQQNYLEKLPIKLPETKEEKQKAEQIIKKVDEILNLAKKSANFDFDDMLKRKETEKLSDVSSAAFHLKDGAKFESLKAEGNKIFINAEDFIEVKDRKTRDFVFAYLLSAQEKLKRARDAKAIIYNLEVPKDEELIKEIAKKAGFDGSEAKGRIEQIENEINELVYELYGITKEERKIIYESLK